MNRRFADEALIAFGDYLALPHAQNGHASIRPASMLAALRLQAS